jgi:type I restriction enzyme S subunit
VTGLVLNGWPVAKLSDVADVRLGKMLSPKAKDPTLTQLAYLRNENVRWGTLDTSDVKTMGFSSKERDRFAVEPGDLLVCEGGEPGRCAVYRGEPGRFMYQKALHRVRCGPMVRPDYLAYWFRRFVSSRIVRSRVSQTTIAHLPLEEIRELEVPVPGIEEQEAIVAELEKHFSRLDAAIAGLKAVRAKLRSYRTAVMKGAVEGHLVQREIDCAAREGRLYESATELLSRTPAPPRPNRWATRSTDVIPGHPALAVGEQTTTLPEGWTWAPLVQVARMESGHTPSREHPEWWDGDIPWISIPDARDHDGGTIHKTSQATNDEGLNNSAARLLPTGTVCVSRTASVGYVVVMGRPMATSQDFVNWIPTPAVTSDWLRLVFSADREALRRFGKGSVHKTIYFPEWLSMHIAVPPLAEQQRITTEVDRLLSGAAKMSESIEENLLRAKALQRVVLRAAFDGELFDRAAGEGQV